MRFFYKSQQLSMPIVGNWFATSYASVGGLSGKLIHCRSGHMATCSFGWYLQKSAHSHGLYMVGHVPHRYIGDVPKHARHNVPNIVMTSNNWQRLIMTRDNDIVTFFMYDEVKKTIQTGQRSWPTTKGENFVMWNAFWPGEPRK